MGLPDERGRAETFAHYLRRLKLEPRLPAEGLASELAGATSGRTGADIAYLCQRAAMLCVKEAATGANEGSGIALARRHFEAALRLLTAAGMAPEVRRVLLAGRLDDEGSPVIVRPYYRLFFATTVGNPCPVNEGTPTHSTGSRNLIVRAFMSQKGKNQSTKPRA